MIQLRLQHSHHLESAMPHSDIQHSMVIFHCPVICLANRRKSYVRLMLLDVSATSVDNSESCYVAVDTSSSAWKLVMTMPMDCDMWSADLDARLAVLNATSINLDRMLLNGETDNYDAEVNNYNAEVDVMNPEVDRYNAECTV